MSRFRLFGRSTTPPAPPPLRLPAPPAAGAPAPWGPATALFGGAGSPRRPTDDPDTDPYGFAPVAARSAPARRTEVGAAAAFPKPTAATFGQFPAPGGDVDDDAPTTATARPAPSLLPRASAAAAQPMPRFPVRANGSAAVLPLVPHADGGAAAGPVDDPAASPIPFDTSPDPAPDPTEAASLACAFAADYLSWDEDDPDRRGRVLVDYLAAPGTDPTHLGWSGTGRQRAEFTIPGRVRADGDGRTLVDVRVRATPYRRTGSAAKSSTPPPTPEPDIAGIPAVAPAPQARGWAALGSYWIRLSVPIVRSGGRLAVDAWEENLGEELEEPRPTSTEPDDEVVDPSLDDDRADAPAGGSVGQPLGGAW